MGCLERQQALYQILLLLQKDLINFPSISVGMFIGMSTGIFRDIILVKEVVGSFTQTKEIPSLRLDYFSLPK